MNWFNVERVGLIVAVAFGLWGIWTNVGDRRASRRARQEALEPMVVVDIGPAESNNDALVLVVENIGPSVARNVRIQVSPPPIRSFDSPGTVPMHDWRLFRQGIATLAPRRRVTYLFDIASRRFNTDGMPLKYQFIVAADGPFGPVGELVYEVDLEPLSDAWVGDPTFKDLVKAVKDTNSTLRDIAKAVTPD